MIHLYSGDGKGKTSIAVGMTVRTLGAGGRAIFAQFMKGNESSEVKILKELPRVRVLKVEKEFGFYQNMTEEDKAEITRYHNAILYEIMECVRNVEKEQMNLESAGALEQKRMNPEDYHKASPAPELLVVLDEITYPCRWQLIDEELFRRLLDELPDCVELVMTGREPLDYMIECADYWSNVEMKRHPYEKGIDARPGVEF